MTHAGDPCDDGLFCTGVERCLEGPRACTAGVDPCAAAGDRCAEDLEACCTPDTSRVCDGDDVVAVDSCARPGAVVAQCATANARGFCLAGTCGCTGGYSGPLCDRCVSFVRPDGDDLADGTSWALARRSVQAGIASAFARTSTHPGCEVWVAAGTYLPGPAAGGSSERTRSFVLRSRVHVYGGFAGNEVRREQRDFAGRPTVLSGDVDGNGVLDDGNSYHVVEVDVPASDVTLDGFTISGGNANGADWASQQSGGIASVTSSTRIANCAFRGNSASSHGGASYLSNSAPTIEDSTFEDNSAFVGGGLAIWGGPATIRRCTFRGNTATQGGGGIWSYESSPVINETRFDENRAVRGGGISLESGAAVVTRCAFHANEASTFGGGLLALKGPGRIEDCAFTGNVALDAGGGMMVMPLGTPEVSRCLFEANSAASGGGGIRSEGTLTITDSVFRANTTSTMGGGVYLNAASAGVARCRFEANTAQSGGGLHVQGAGTWIADSVFVRNSAAFAGAMHVFPPASTVTGCTFFENTGGLGCGALGGNQAAVAVANSIFWRNSAPEITAGVMGWTFVHGLLVAGCPTNATCTALVTASPRFFDEGSGGTAPDLHLGPGSACLDAGDNTVVATSTDLDGRPRIADANGDGAAVVDLGAYERPGP